MSLDRSSSNPELRKIEQRLPWTHRDVSQHDTLTRAHLADAVLSRFGLSRRESRQIIEQILVEIGAALVRGESIKLAGFGSFNPRSKSARPGRNPKSGAEATVSPRRVLAFKSSPILRQRVNAL